ncbi:ArpU family transcriptional regulator [Bacillus cereus]|uniref:ArpU family transcriptional regulator n=1 Tax=Bacillus cereus TaxID=1396 RepID=UPI0039817467
MNQLSFYKHVDEKEIRPFVIEELRKYKVLQIRFQNENERKKLGAELLFCELKQIDKHEIKYKQLKRAFEQALDEDEQRILDMKYMGVKDLNDDYIYPVLGMKRDKFYKKKKSAIVNLAMALGMI